MILIHLYSKYRKIFNRIFYDTPTGGDDSGPGEWPWMARLLYPDDNWCGGIRMLKSTYQFYLIAQSNF